MKPFAIIMIVLVLAAVCAVGYLYLTARIDVRFVSCIATDAVSQLDYYNEMRDKLASSAFVGTRFSSDDPGTAD